MPKVYKNTQYDTFFVKDGWMNGVKGEGATTTGFGRQLKDGWYYLLDDEDDGVGPHETQEGADAAAKNQIDDIQDIAEQHVLGGN